MKVGKAPAYLSDRRLSESQSGIKKVKVSHIVPTWHTGGEEV
jgi:hypothetical protein